MRLAVFIYVNGGNARTVVNERDAEFAVLATLDVDAHFGCVCIKGVVKDLTATFHRADADASCRRQKLTRGHERLATHSHQASPPNAQ